jgi:hypothetical protein
MPLLVAANDRELTLALSGCRGDLCPTARGDLCQAADGHDGVQQPAIRQHEEHRDLARCGRRHQ